MTKNIWIPETRTRPLYTKASAVKVTKADGSVVSIPAYKTIKEMNEAIYTKKNKRSYK